MTGDDIRRAIEAATSLTNPRLSEVEWDDVARELGRLDAADESVGLSTALAIHGAVHKVLQADAPDWEERIVGARFVGIMLGIDLSSQHSRAAGRLREAMAVMQDDAGFPDGRHDMDEEVERIARATLAEQTEKP